MDADNSEKKPAGGTGAPGIPEIEKQITEFWEKNEIFLKSLDQTKDGQPYTFYDGPPFATGLPHYGHILASTIKDVIPRYQTMRGRYVRRRWGWDCHGLPIESLVEKKLGISGKKQIEELGIQTFNETCRSVVLQYVEEWGKMVRRLGRWVDFDHSYKTMDRTYMESVWWAFKQIYDKEIDGDRLAYEGRKVLLYCPRCETPISNFEVAMDNSYQDVTEESVYVKFRVTPGQKIGDWSVPENTFFVAWTTTPWTLPGNVALAVGENIDYDIEELSVKEDNAQEKERRVLETIIFSKVLADKVLAPGSVYAPGIMEGNLVKGNTTRKFIKGVDLVGLSYEPLYKIDDVAASEKAFKVYAADFVTTEDGTGIVHTAVVYGEDDYKLGLREGLPVVPLLDEKGHFNDKVPELIRGQYFKKAEKAVKEDLETRGLLLKREPYTHSYPHCWRCGTALYYNAIPAWFINVQKIKADLLRTNDEQMNWFPAHLKHGRYAKSVEAAPDWNISRNRYWGNPIPVWKCAQCEKVKVVGGLDDLRAASIKKNNLLFIRHGEATHIVDGYCGPAEDTAAYTSHLTEKGKQEVEAGAQALAGKKIDLIVSSPLARMRETVDIVKKYTDAPVEFYDELHDIDHGGLVKHEEWDREVGETTDFEVAFPGGGESRAHAKARMAKFLREMNAKYSGKTILIATHGDNLLMMQGILRGLSNKELLDAPYPAMGQLYEFDWAAVPFNDNGELDLHRPYIDDVVLKCDCGGAMHRTPEVFDSWVEAGSMPFAEYHYPFENKEVFEEHRFPAQFVTEYIAQTRAWFYVMHVISQIIFGRAPFQNVLTTGTILAEDGAKMSKSKNNFPDPWLVIDKYGVDSMRFYLMSSVVMQADNLNFSEAELGTVHRKVTMLLWNVQQYFKTYAGEGSEKLAAGSAPHVLDAWILARQKELVAAVTDGLDGYDTPRATRAIAEFVDDLSTWYLRRSRGRDDAEFFPNFRRVLLTTAQVIAPFMPHIAEAMYQDLRATTDAESVHLTTWPAQENLTAADLKLIGDMRTIREAASMVLAERKSANVPVRQPLARVALMELAGKPVALAPEMAEVLLSEVNVKVLAPIDKDEAGILKAANEHYVLFLDMNVTEELKLEGEVRKLEREVQEKRKEMGFKVGEMARLTYPDAADAALAAAFEKIDKKKTYLVEIKKGAVLNGTFELARA